MRPSTRRELGAECADLGEDRRGRVGRRDNVGGQPGRGRVGGRRAARVARGRDRDLADTEFTCACNGHRQPAGLETRRRVLAFVLDSDSAHPDLLGERGRVEERCEALAERQLVRRVTDREDLGVPPERRLAPRQIARLETRTDRVQIVSCVERLLTARRKPRQLLTRIHLPTASALQLRGAAALP